MKQKKTATATRVVTKSGVLTWDEHVAMYEEKNRKIWKQKAQSKNKRRKGSRGRQRKKNRRRTKEQEKGPEVVLEKEMVEYVQVVVKETGHMHPPNPHPEESTAKEEEAAEDEFAGENFEENEEDWECKACGDDDGDAADFIGYYTWDRWFMLVV